MKWYSFSLAWLGFLFPPFLLADIGENFGFGSRSAGLASFSAALDFGPYSAYQNPATLAKRGEKKIALGMGALYMKPSFTPIKNIVVENSTTSDRTGEKRGNVDLNYRPTFGQKIGLSIQPFPDWWNLSFGFTFYSPFNHLSYLDSGENFAPEYVLHRARTQRPQIEMGLGVQPFSSLSFGAGVRLGYSATTTGNMFIATSSKKTSRVRAQSTLKPKAGPFLGSYLNLDWIKMGAVIRFPVHYHHYLRIESSAELLAGTAAPDIIFDSTSVMQYDPLSIELGTQFIHSKNWSSFVQVDFQRWSRFEPPAMFVENEGSGIQISEGQVPTYVFRDLWIPKIGQEFGLSSSRFRFGYSFRAGILKSPPSGAGNVVDPDRHIGSLGYGIQFEEFLGFQTHWNLDIHLAYHHLVSAHIEKQPGNEQGALGSSKVGSPGYDIGGHLFGGGMSLKWVF